MQENASQWPVFELKIAVTLEKIMKEFQNHLKHLEVTFDRLIACLFTEKEFDAITRSVDIGPELLAQKTAWIRVDDLAVEGVTTSNMALIHLLWFQRVGRIVIEDIDPFYGLICLHLELKDIIREKEREKHQSHIS